MRTRANGIRTALEEYNKYAPTLNLPREKLSWNSIIETTSLAEFDLLRDARLDIRGLAWAQPANREAARLYHEIERAKEEKVWLNVEIR